MTGPVRRVSAIGRSFTVRRLALFARGVLYLGRRYRCPVCGWSLRSFVGRRSVLATTVDGYCPRCNAKARHRRIWRYLRRRTDLWSGRHRLLEVAPVWAFARRLQRMPGIRYTGVDLWRTGPHVTVVGDVTALPLGDASVDVVLCIHVLEHVAQDRRAIAELYRVLESGGWALVSAPLCLDGPTDEDPAVTDPDERARRFGEEDHVRWYGLDLGDRLRAVGFQVELDRAEDIPDAEVRRYGLRRDEHLFLCRKPASPDQLSRAPAASAATTPSM